MAVRRAPVLSLLPPLFRDVRIREVIELARLAENVGYGGFWYADERFERDPYTVLAACALATDSILVGPAVTDPYSRHPALTAVAIAALDEVSGRRARLGMGAGISGFDKIHVKPRHPAAAVREAVHVVRRLLAGATVTLDGLTTRITGGALRFAARSDIPIVVAADGPRMMDVAGSIADGVVVAHTASPTELARRMMPALAATREVSEPLRVVLRLDVTVAADRNVAKSVARIRVGRVLWSQYPTIPYLKTLGLSLPVELERRLRQAGPFTRTHDLRAFARFADAIPDELVHPVALAGTARDVASQLLTLFEAGIDEVMAHPLVADGESISTAIEGVAEAFRLALSDPAFSDLR